MAPNPYVCSSGWAGLLRRVVLAAAVAALAVSTAPAAVWDVSTFSALKTASISANPGDQIIIAAGNYHVTQPLYITTPDLTFSGASGNRNDVVLYGNGMNVESGVTEGFWAAASGIRLENVTIRDFWHHGIHICGAPYADNVVISNVRTVNCGERHVKGSSGSGISDNVIIENLWMEQTEPYLPRPGHSVDPNNYIGGIDAMHINNWTIRDSTALNIRGATGGGRAGIFLWNGVSNLTLERNMLINNGHGISIGNPSGPNGSHVDPWHAEGGVIRNNFIVRRGETSDWALELDNTKDFEVYNNTIYSDVATYFRTVQIYDEAGEGQTTNLQMINNLIRGRVYDLSSGDWSSAAVAAMGNLVDTNGTVVLPSWFVDAAGGDLHLTELAIGAIDQATTLVQVPDDIDGQSRPIGLAPDMGADERGDLPPPPPEDVWMDHEIKYVNGKYGITFILRCDDGIGPSAIFAEMIYEGTNGGQLEQVSAFGTFSVDDETNAEIYDGLPAANYDKDQDSWFMDEFAGTGASVLLLNESPNFYEIESGTPPGEPYEDLAHAYIVSTGDVAYTGLVARAQWWNVVGVVDVPPPGDANRDDYVDGLDYVVWSNNYLQTDVGWEGADFNGDGIADGLDYVLWSNFYNPQPGGMVPEPGCLLLLLAAGPLALRRRRQA